MKKYFFILATAIGLAACGDNATNDTGGSIDSAGSAPMESPSDNTVPSEMNTEADTSASMSRAAAAAGAAPPAPTPDTPATDTTPRGAALPDIS